MHKQKILFIGGPPGKFASVRIRCARIAQILGCDYRTSIRNASDIPMQYSAFICVKAGLSTIELAKLATRGPVLWDVIDQPPPQHDISLYITSTHHARYACPPGATTKVIPHYHCNSQGIPNPPHLRRMGWVGSPHWCPDLPLDEVDVYDSTGMTPAEVYNAYRKIGIGLNLRKVRPNSAIHIQLNSGIKLINTIGFGIPSICSNEPAYVEIGSECTLLSNLADFKELAMRLHADDDLYSQLRERCLAKAREFHITMIAQKYERLINEL